MLFPLENMQFPEAFGKIMHENSLFCRFFSRKMQGSNTFFTCLCMKSYTLAQNPTPNPSSENANKYRMFEVWV